MIKAKRLWARFLALAGEQARLNAIPAIGNAPAKSAYVVNVFRNDGIRRARALQLLQDLERVLQEEGISLQEFVDGGTGINK